MWINRRVKWLHSRSFSAFSIKKPSFASQKSVYTEGGHKQSFCLHLHTFFRKQMGFIFLEQNLFNHSLNHSTQWVLLFSFFWPIFYRAWRSWNFLKKQVSKAGKHSCQVWILWNGQNSSGVNQLTLCGCFSQSSIYLYGVVWLLI